MDFIIEIVGEIVGEVFEFISELAFDEKRSFATRLVCLSVVVLTTAALIGVLLFIGISCMERTLVGGIIIIAITVAFGVLLSCCIISKLKKKRKRIE